MTKAIIIDDELYSIETLAWKIENYTENVDILATFSNPKKGLAYLQKHSIDLLFLDIEMPNLNGFEILKALKPIPFDVIFTTAYNEFGIKAIKYSALDYLLKPIKKEELIEAVAKHQNKAKPNLLPTQLEVLLQNMNKNNLEKRRIALATKESIDLVYPKDIVLCQADNNYTNVYMDGNRKKLISKTLKEFVELLEEHGFFRPHQSYLINLDHIVKYVRKDGGYLLMSNGLKVPVARNRKESLLALF